VLTADSFHLKKKKTKIDWINVEGQNERFIYAALKLKHCRAYTQQGKLITQYSEMVDHLCNFM